MYYTHICSCKKNKKNEEYNYISVKVEFEKAAYTENNFYIFRGY